MMTTVKRKAAADPLPYPKLVQNINTSEVYLAFGGNSGLNLQTYSTVALNFGDGSYEDFDGQVILKNT